MGDTVSVRRVSDTITNTQKTVQDRANETLNQGAKVLLSRACIPTPCTCLKMRIHILLKYACLIIREGWAAETLPDWNASLVQR